MTYEIVPPDAERPQVLVALARKRGEIAGQIAHGRKALLRLQTELDHIDATIRIFCATLDISAIPIKPLPPPFAGVRGDMSRLVFEVFREAQRPVTAHDIAKRLMDQRGFETNDKEIAALILRRVRACLRMHRNNGHIRPSGAVGMLKGWEMVR